MSVVTEYRLKCDYCGVVSPVVPNADTLARGWVAEFYTARGGVVVKWNAKTGKVYTKPHLFCCQLHLDKWLAEQEQTA